MVSLNRSVDAAFSQNWIRRENMKRKHAASEDSGSHLPVKKARSQQPWHQHLKNYAQTVGMFRFGDHLHNEVEPHLIAVV